MIWLEMNREEKVKKTILKWSLSLIVYSIIPVFIFTQTRRNFQLDVCLHICIYIVCMYLFIYVCMFFTSAVQLEDVQDHLKTIQRRL